LLLTPPASERLERRNASLEAAYRSTRGAAVGVSVAPATFAAPSLVSCLVIVYSKPGNVGAYGRGSKEEKWNEVFRIMVLGFGNRNTVARRRAELKMEPQERVRVTAAQRPASSAARTFRRITTFDPAVPEGQFRD
jgi:hypothetical protein